MTTSMKPMARWLRGLVVAGVVLMPLRAEVHASPGTAEHPVTASAPNLRLAPTAAARIALQEGDTEKPRNMKTSVDEEAAPMTSPKAAPARPAAANDNFAFVKDWPFWVIVGGVALVAVGGILIYKNAQGGEKCPPLDTAGCYGG